MNADSEYYHSASKGIFLHFIHPRACACTHTHTHTHTHIYIYMYIYIYKYDSQLIRNGILMKKIKHCNEKRSFFFIKNNHNVEKVILIKNELIASSKKRRISIPPHPMQCSRYFCIAIYIYIYKYMRNIIKHNDELQWTNEYFFIKI